VAALIQCVLQEEREARRVWSVPFMPHVNDFNRKNQTGVSFVEKRAVFDADRLDAFQL